MSLLWSTLAFMLVIVPSCLSYDCEDSVCQNCNVTDKKDIKINYEAVVAKISAIFDAANTNGDDELSQDEFVNELCAIDEGEECPKDRSELLEKAYIQIRDLNNRDNGLERLDALLYLQELANNPQKYNDPSYETFLGLVFHYFDFNADGVILMEAGDALEICDQYLQYRNFHWLVFRQCMNMADALFSIFNCDGNDVITLPELLTVVQSGLRYKE